jgi:hypothetical protein
MRTYSTAAKALMHMLWEICDDSYRLADQRGMPMNLADISRGAGMNAATVKRALGELEAGGAVTFAEDGCYTMRASVPPGLKTDVSSDGANEPKSMACDPHTEVRVSYRDTISPNPSTTPAHARSKSRATPTRTPEPAIAAKATRTGKIRQSMFPEPPAPLPAVVADLDLAVGLKECAAILGVDDVERRWPGFSRMIVEALEPRAYSYFERVIKHALKGVAWRAKDIEGTAYFRTVIARIGERVGYDTLTDAMKLRLAWSDETWLELLRSNPDRKSA